MLKLDSTIVVGEVVEANLRVRTGPGSPGKIFNPCKPWKSPGIFLLSPGKSHRTLFKKNCEMHFVDFIASNNCDCKFSYHIKTSFCVGNHCLVLKRYTWSTLLLYSDDINY